MYVDRALTGLAAVQTTTIAVAFVSDGSLDPLHDVGANPAVYVRRISTAALSKASTTLASRATGDATSAVGGYDASISRDGSKVAFSALASLDPADTGIDSDVYVRDLNANTTTLVSRPTGSVDQQNGQAQAPVIAADGSSIAYASTATNLGGTVSGLTASHIYVRRLATAVTIPVSVVNGSAALLGDRSSFGPSISDDGSHVAFATLSTNMNAGETDNRYDVYVRNVSGPPETIWASRADGPAGAPTSGASGTYDASLAGDSSAVQFTRRPPRSRPAHRVATRHRCTSAHSRSGRHALPRDRAAPTRVRSGRPSPRADSDARSTCPATATAAPPGGP